MGYEPEEGSGGMGNFTTDCNVEVVVSRCVAAVVAAARRCGRPGEAGSVAWSRLMNAEVVPVIASNAGRGLGSGHIALEALQMVIRDIPFRYHLFLDNQIGHFCC